MEWWQFILKEVPWKEEIWSLSFTHRKMRRIRFPQITTEAVNLGVLTSCPLQALQNAFNFFFSFFPDIVDMDAFFLVHCYAPAHAEGEVDPILIVDGDERLPFPGTIVYKCTDFFFLSFPLFRDFLLLLQIRLRKR